MPPSLKFHKMLNGPSFNDKIVSTFYVYKYQFKKVGTYLFKLTTNIGVMALKNNFPQTEPLKYK